MQSAVGPNRFGLALHDGRIFSEFGGADCMQISKKSKKIGNFKRL